MVGESIKKKKETRSSTDPIGITSRKMNLNLSEATNSSIRPTYSHITALVGRTEQLNAAIARASFLELPESLPELALI